VIVVGVLIFLATRPGERMAAVETIPPAQRAATDESLPGSLAPKALHRRACDMNTVTARVGKPQKQYETAIEGIEKQLVPFFTARLIGVREADIENALRVNGLCQTGCGGTFSKGVRRLLCVSR